MLCLNVCLSLHVSFSRKKNMNTWSKSLFPNILVWMSFLSLSSFGLFCPVSEMSLFVFFSFAKLEKIDQNIMCPKVLVWMFFLSLSLSLQAFENQSNIDWKMIKNNDWFYDRVVIGRCLEPSWIPNRRNIDRKSMSDVKWFEQVDKNEHQPTNQPTKI